VFLNYAKDSDILVHECTYPDFELSRAEEVNHSTFTQAINIGRRVGAKNLILTHYSPSCLKYIGDIINMDGSINEGKYKDFFNKFYP
jgi:ribonuclease BN (tRNA processing enzyme)